MDLLLLPSPLLGPTSYEPLADALRGRGDRVSIAACPEPVRPERLVEDWGTAAAAAELLPEPWFSRVDTSAPRLGLDYFDTEVTPPAGWSGRASGYLAFGTTYAAEAACARQAGWPVTELPGHHLWHLARPDEVDEALNELLERVLHLP